MLLILWLDILDLLVNLTTTQPHKLKKKIRLTGVGLGNSGVGGLVFSWVFWLSVTTSGCKRGSVVAGSIVTTFGSCFAGFKKITQSVYTAIGHYSSGLIWMLERKDPRFNFWWGQYWCCKKLYSTVTLVQRSRSDNPKTLIAGVPGCGFAA